MMNRGQIHGAGAVQVAQGADHPTIQLDGLSDAPGAYCTGGLSKLRRAAHAVGALMSLAVLGTGAYWGYTQIMRDTYGVPVVRALEGPMRVAPDDPGGLVASNSGLAVNAVQAVGSASAPEERLVLAPEPVALTAEDLSEAERQEAGETVLTGTAEADDAEIVSGAVKPQTISLQEDVPANDPIARAIALATASTAGALPISGTEIDASGENKTKAVLAGPGLKRSPRPARRPAVRVSSGQAAGTVKSTPAVMDASAVPAGTRLVQLGAFDSADEARAAWTRVAARFEELMDDKTQVIVEAEAGGHTFWRLRAMGFADLSEARRFCAALVAERADCIPVVAR